jgi:hypothetical protein
MTVVRRREKSSGAASEFRCCVCRRALTREELFSFGGGFGCRDCVSASYRLHGPETVAEELRLRAQEAVAILERRPGLRQPLSRDEEDL